MELGVARDQRHLERPYQVQRGSSRSSRARTNKFPDVIGFASGYGLRGEVVQMIASNVDARHGLLGRDAEVTRIRQLSTAPGGPVFVMVTGEPGIGKSQLLATFARLTADRPALVGRATEFERNAPLGLVLDVLADADSALSMNVHRVGDTPGGVRSDEVVRAHSRRR
ncbi:AAA family ATPase [Micromonospora violae]|uniref:AAA family ATPase n=1 Tax=Micromonospora violae TaxID=1278207 RepID=UPI00102AC8CB|nr:ATP-binding protein [Micromonospora violae]